jgi:hypothetical protein
MTDLLAAIDAAPRQALLRYIIRTIHGFTIMARDPDASAEARADINNRIHYLAGHMMALLDPDMALDEWQRAGIAEHASRLYSRLAADNFAELMAR